MLLREQGGAAASRGWSLRRAPAGDLALIGAAAAAPVLVAAFIWLAPPLSDLYPSADRVAFPEWVFLLNPEPVEATRFLIAAALPLALALAVAAVRGEAGPRRSLDPAVLAIQLLALAFLLWCFLEQWQIRDELGPDAYDQRDIPPANLVAGAAIGLSLVLVLLRERVPFAAGASRLTRRLGPRATFAATASVAVIATAIWLLPALVTDPTLGLSGSIPNGGIPLNHIPVQAEEYFAAVNGRTPLVDFTSQYASLLPLLTAPVLAARDLSINSFSAVMVAFSLIALLAVFGVFRLVTDRSWIALALYIPFLAFSLIPWAQMGAVIEYNANYYALLPNRYLGPLLLAWICARRIRRGSPPVWILFFVAGLTVLNNLEFGLPALAAVAAASLLGSRPGGTWRERMLAASTQAAAGLTGALALVCAVTLIRAGALPDLSRLAYWSELFAREGYGLIESPTLGLHWVMYLTYVAALLAAAVRYARSAPNRTLTGMLAFAGVFGLGTGGYYAGRSLPLNLLMLFPAWGLAIGLLTWTVAVALRSSRRDRRASLRLLPAALAVMAGFGVMVSTLTHFPPPWDQLERLDSSSPAVVALSAEQDFVERRTDEGDDVLIIGTPLDHRVAERSGVANASPFASLYALFSPREVNEALDALEERNGHVVFEGVARNTITVAPPAFERRIYAIFRQRGYALVARDPVSGLTEWRLASG